MVNTCGVRDDMSYHEEPQGRLRRLHTRQAIALAMQGRWQEAVSANKRIIESFPHDVDAHNRLGKAYMGLGEYSLAREAYSRALELDPANTIADKNLRRLSQLRETAVGARGEAHRAEPQHFIEEIGKAGVVDLYDLAPKEIRARMVAGDKVYLKAEGSGLMAENSRGEYLGRVAPRPAQRLARLMAGGNRYSAAVVSSLVDMLTVIIRETYQDPSQAGRLSFPPKGLEEVRPYVSDRIAKPDSEYEEEAEEESGYTIIGGDEIEVLPEEAADADDDTARDEE